MCDLTLLVDAEELREGKCACGNRADHHPEVIGCGKGLGANEGLLAQTWIQIRVFRTIADMVHPTMGGALPVNGR